MRRRLYLDTGLWNKLFEQNVGQAFLTESLRQNGWELALSPHVMYELAKSFHAKRTASQQKAIPLFSYLDGFLKLPISFVKQVPDLLREEIRAAIGRIPKIDPFYRDENRDRMTEEIRKLAVGRVDSRFDDLFEYRSGQVATFRAGSSERAAKWESWRKKNQDLDSEGFMQMSVRQFAAQMMELHVSNAFTLPSKDIRRVARKLLSAQRFRFSHALIRANIYIDWLIFQGRAIQRDTLDDCYHIENAAHCDVYATDESRQEFPADMILEATEVRIHDRKEPLLKWLTTTAIR